MHLFAMQEQILGSAFLFFCPRVDDACEGSRGTFRPVKKPHSRRIMHSRRNSNGCQFRLAPRILAPARIIFRRVISCAVASRMYKFEPKTRKLRITVRLIIARTRRTFQLCRATFLQELKKIDRGLIRELCVGFARL